ncbi:nuclear transport factor 2 family protein [Alteromonas ponticola]|uniref:Nuclear transport factor 2 family protein n=1 Tax=Alteromonas aquimaris TaxID=2998417 RepID=A0ABT3P7F8_9ALTE|nr:nuclear transport factor 2 family protein [Alteromonas aquimaris]MCW8108016.1 nuclear transport factor 2 family protein [Alteromonas aquimaris]
MRVFVLLWGLVWVLAATAEMDDASGSTFAQHYFKAWEATQMPDASEEELDAYLALLTDDVGYQHLPYVTSGLRTAGGKAELKKGLLHYLGSTTSYQATLEKVMVGHNVIVIQYHTVVTGVHPDTQQATSLDYRSVDVLELDEGRVAVIRHYSK